MPYKEKDASISWSLRLVVLQRQTLSGHIEDNLAGTAYDAVKADETIRKLVSRRLQVGEHMQARASFRSLMRVFIPSSCTTWYKSQTYSSVFRSSKPAFLFFRSYFCVFCNYDIVTSFSDPIRIALLSLKALIQLAVLNLFGRYLTIEKCKRNFYVLVTVFPASLCQFPGKFFCNVFCRFCLMF